MPSEAALSLTNALRDKVKEILAINPYYLVRREALRRQVEIVQANASGNESWSSIRNVFTVLALVSYYDTARDEMPAVPVNEITAEEAARVGELVAKVRNEIPLNDVDNLVNAFTAIESVATVEREISEDNNPRKVRMLSPFLIIRHLQNHSSYYASELPSMITTRTSVPNGVNMSATPGDLTSFISSDFSYNYMIAPLGGWGSQPPDVFSQFLAVVDRHIIGILQQARQQNVNGTSVTPESLVKTIEDRMATVLLAGIIHKNRSTFMAAFPIPPTNNFPMAASKWE